MCSEELVLGVASESLAEAGFAHGVTLGEAAGGTMATIYREGQFLPRSSVERDPSLLQPIPCTLIRAGSGFLTLRRGESSRSSPLHGRSVIWVGGHVRLEDSKEREDFLASALAREVEEELAAAPAEYEFMGLVAPQNSRHFAVLYQTRITEALLDEMSPNEEFLQQKGRSWQAKFSTVRDLHEMNRRLDLWSRMILSDVLGRRSRVAGPQLPLPTDNRNR